METLRRWTKKRINDDKKRKCGHKIKYQTIQEAERHARLLMMKDGRHSSAYKCPYCRYYHCGHTPYEKMVEALANG